MSAYEELVERCAFEEGLFKDDVRRVLAEVLRTLETVTPEMFVAWGQVPVSTIGDRAVRDYLAMLHASPLEPPK